jgi:hypothetical protein
VGDSVHAGSLLAFDGRGSGGFFCVLLVGFDLRLGGHVLLLKYLINRKSNVGILIEIFKEKERAST